MPTLVTGATGLVGNNVVRALFAHGRALRALVREGADPRPLQGLDVEIVRGDVRDPDQVRRGVRELTRSSIRPPTCILAGPTGISPGLSMSRGRSTWPRRLGRPAPVWSTFPAWTLWASVRAAGWPTRIRRRAERSSVPTWSPSERPSTWCWPPWSAGLDAVIVNPGFLLGPWDWKPSSGRMLLDVARRFTPAAPIGGATMCDVRDVAAGIIAAMERGATGRRYILGGHCTTYLDAWRLFAQVAGARGPLVPRRARDAASSPRRRPTCGPRPPDASSWSIRPRSACPASSTTTAARGLRRSWDTTAARCWNP